MSTKEKILAAALKRFNEQGIVNVRLQHIADEAFISVGNLAYHFPNKEAIALALYQTFSQQQQTVLKEYCIVPLFEYIDRFIRDTFHLQQQYVFFYLDTLEIVRAYPSIGEAHQQHISYQIAQLQTILQFNLARGAMNPPSEAQAYEQLATQLWFTIDFWRSQQLVRKGSPLELEDYKKAVWSLLVPHFSEMGRQEYAQMLQRPYDFLN